MNYGSAMAIMFTDDDDHEIMESTGLLDKHGVEICEGDICRGRVHQVLYEVAGVTEYSRLEARGWDRVRVRIP